uniref:Uncharacterized protein n=1 Tax=Solanum lycopersicum TaxID=4081 RepID=A0A3Q7EHZ5_SOLLC
MEVAKKNRKEDAEEIAIEDGKSEKLKVKKVIDKGNMDGIRIYAENTIRKRKEQMNYQHRESTEMSERMDSFERSMAGSTSLSTLEDPVSVGLPQAADHAISSEDEKKVNEVELSRHFAELKSRGGRGRGKLPGENNGVLIGEDPESSDTTRTRHFPTGDKLYCDLLVTPSSTFTAVFVAFTAFLRRRSVRRCRFEGII